MQVLDGEKHQVFAREWNVGGSNDVNATDDMPNGCDIQPKA